MKEFLRFVQIILICFLYIKRLTTLQRVLKLGERLWTQRRQEKYIPSGYLTSKLSLIRVTELMTRSFSNVRHIEEIKAAGMELPSVNQLEVSTSTAQREKPVDNVIAGDSCFRSIPSANRNSSLTFALHMIFGWRHTAVSSAEPWITLSFEM